MWPPNNGYHLVLKHTLEYNYNNKEISSHTFVIEFLHAQGWADFFIFKDGSNSRYHLVISQLIRGWFQIRLYIQEIAFGNIHTLTNLVSSQLSCLNEYKDG